VRLVIGMEEDVPFQERPGACDGPVFRTRPFDVHALNSRFLQFPEFVRVAIGRLRGKEKGYDPKLSSYSVLVSSLLLFKNSGGRSSPPARRCWSH
jgi:hypothetical protein